MNQFLELCTEMYSNQAIRYIFFGCCSTLVNLVSFRLLRMAGLSLSVANFISIVLAILFAYVVNARFVFDNQFHGLRENLAPFAKFISARLITMALEMVGVPLLAKNLGKLRIFEKRQAMAELGGKILTNVVVMILNYIFSKFIVFTKDPLQASASNYKCFRSALGPVL